MDRSTFRNANGQPVTAVTADEMRAVDRVAVEEIGLDVVRMMEHAGRGLAETVLDIRPDGPVTVVAGNGGNGGGGLACARHLANRDVPTRVVLDREPAEIDDVTAVQLRILNAMAVPVSTIADRDRLLDAPPDSDHDGVVVDALIGYGLTGTPRGSAAELIERMADFDGRIVALDVPSGVNATTGETPGVAVAPDVTATLALPKTGLATVGDDVRLVDLSIPAIVYERLGIEYAHPFESGFVVPLDRSDDVR